MTATAVPRTPSGRRARKVTTSSPLKRGSAGPAESSSSPFLIVAAVLWMIPLLWAFYTSLRPTEYFFDHSYFSIGGPYNFDNYGKAWEQADLPLFFKNTLIITLPAVLLTLFLASLAAFKLSKVPWRYNVVVADPVHRGKPACRSRCWRRRCSRLAKHTPLPLSISDSGSFINTYFVGHRGEHRVPDGLLHLRDEQLHEGAAASS